MNWLIQVQILLRFIWQCAAVILLRKYRPDIPQPFTMWLYPLPAYLSGALWLFIFFTGPWEGIVFSVVFLLAGIAAYVAFLTDADGGDTETRRSEAEMHTAKLSALAFTPRRSRASVSPSASLVLYGFLPNASRFAVMRYAPGTPYGSCRCSA